MKGSKMNQDKGYTLDDLFSKLNEDINFRKADRQIRPYFDIAEQLIRLRNEQKLTQKDLAEIMGTHQSRISKIESGENDFRLSTLIEIAEALETEVCIQLIPFAESKPSEESQYITLFVNPLSSKIEPISTIQGSLSLV